MLDENKKPDPKFNAKITSGFEKKIVSNPQKLLRVKINTVIRNISSFTMYTKIFLSYWTAPGQAVLRV